MYADASGFTAAMAESEDRAISRLQAGQRLIRQSAAAFGGRVVDTAGDSALVVFESARAAFKAAQQIQTQTKIQEKTAERIVPFPCRIGLTKGPVKVHGNRVYGHLVNLAARIESLVGRGNIGVEKTTWNEVQPLAHGVETRSKVLFARPEEPAVQFFEIGDRVDFDDYRTGENSRNQPVVLVVPFSDGAASPLRDSAFEAVLWECSALFNSYGWHSEIVRGSAAVIELPTFSADYVIRLRITGFASGLRISASFSSRHSKHGMQNFTQESASESECAQCALAIASLVGTAIVHCETERAGVSHGIGSFQLVTAGRELISGLSPKSIARGLQFLRRAYEIDAEYPTLLSSLGRAHAIAWRFGSTEEGVDHLELARKYADKAVSLAPNDPRCRADLGFVKFWNNEVDESAWLYERSLTALPFHPELTADAGMVFSYVGRNDEAAAILERSVTNLPSSADYRLWSLGDVYFSKHDYRNSLRWLGRMSDQSQAQRLLAASKARLGLDSSPHVSAVLSQQPDFSVSRWVSIQPFANEEDRVDFEQALLLAGLPP